jgi:6-pyruvoyl-tetrahydropterin synthase
LKQKTFVLDRNPTAENIAQFLATEVSPRVLKGTGVKVVKIVVQETENCFAECVVE